MSMPSKFALMGCMLVFAAAGAHAQTPTSGEAAAPVPQVNLGDVQPVMGEGIYAHALFNQFEDRWSGRNQQFRYEGEAWAGTDLNKLWVKSEGIATGNGRFTDNQNEFLYSRAVSTFWNLQAGMRVDLNSGVDTRTWAAFGVEGLSLYFFELSATGYVSDQGRFAAKVEAFYDLLITQRLILQPQIEINLYSKADPATGTGSGLSDIDTGLRLRYEITRKFAPYIGVTYAGRFFQSANFARREQAPANDVRFVFGIRTWF
jgi:copper resistance protein B